MEHNHRETIRIRGAAAHNLKDLSLEIPHYQLIVVTGVSGSGKSSLAFEVIAREGQRRYLETFSSFSRQFMGKMNRSAVAQIDGLSPVIMLSQKTTGSNARSTVGTMSDLYDSLRLLFARLGKADEATKLQRSLFSFNTPQGACPTCKGLGVEEKISLTKLVADPDKTLREGALAPTLPTGYIMYSQVTIDVLNQVCQAHGFDVEIPWNQLSPAQQDIVLNGSTRIKVPFGKHNLESRLKWTGITAKPREEGHYKGMMPIMTDILRRDRNANILRYAESLTCSACQGKRLNPQALSVKLHAQTIADLAALDLRALRNWLQSCPWTDREAAIAGPVQAKMLRQIELLDKLGLGHLSLDRPAATLSGGEAQRIRLVNQVTAEMSHVLYVFDEPSIGMHPQDHQHMMDILRTLVRLGNTVIVVEHDLATIRQADWIVDIGPGAGAQGGKLLFNGPMAGFLFGSQKPEGSATWQALQAGVSQKMVEGQPDLQEFIVLENCRVNNLQGFTARLQKGAFNVVTGVSGAGKSSLVHGVLQPLAGSNAPQGIDKLVTIDQKPIGRTPRSNPATYTGLADHLRDLFAKLPAARTAKFSKSRFSFNTKGGRCETCQGAGRIQIGMHFMGNVDVICEICEGRRFNAETLTIRYEGRNISEVYDLTVREALGLFADQPKIMPFLATLDRVGLGYVQLGQPSSTLSGGEAQRIKLATALRTADTGNTLYLLDEPTVGLHAADVQVLIAALRRLSARGNTVVCIEHDTDLIRQADWVVDLGPGSGREGGRLLGEGSPAHIAQNPDSPTGAALRGDIRPKPVSKTVEKPDFVELSGVSTHFLKNINLRIPRQQLTVITGVSGSGKSSLAFDTLYAEARSRFSESLSTYVRSQLKQSNPARLEASRGLGPAVAIGRKHLAHSARSTVGTVSGLYDHFRLLYSRMAQAQGFSYTARHFSFNHQSGACPECDGLGFQWVCDPEKLIVHPENAIAEGIVSKNKRSQFYANPHGQYLATLRTVAEEKSLDLTSAWKDLPNATQDIVLYGTGEKEWEVTWEFKNKTRNGVQELKTTWQGLCNYLTEEYQRRHTNKNIDDLRALLSEEACPACQGARLRTEMLAVRVLGKNIAELTDASVEECRNWFEADGKGLKSEVEREIWVEIKAGVVDLLDTLAELGLGFLALSRAAGTLSGGEGQRLRLAGALSANLYGVIYVLDEPTIGLHEKDTQPLLGILRRLIDRGNTVVVVEHDETMIRAANFLVEMGPGPGRNGGEVVLSGTLDEMLAHPTSPTGSFLRNPQMPKPKARDLRPKAFGLRGVNLHNLQNLDVDFTAGGIIAVSGVSGSGKSTLIHQVLLRSARAMQAVGCAEVFGLDQFAKILSVDQSPLSGSLQSTPATYTGLLEVLRTLYAGTAVAKEMGLGKSAFSYVHKDGKCPACAGMGQQKIALDFLGDVWLPCEECGGGRYRPESLACQWQGKTIAEALQLSVAEAMEWAASQPKLVAKLQPLAAVGLGHVLLGQATATLSGGEAQRLRLAAELMQQGTGKHLFLLDEPSTGLHFQDILRLAALFDQLADAGHTVLFIEHHPMLIGMANQVITLTR